MYLYVPIDGRSLVVGSHTISGTGMQFSEKIPELDAVLGVLLELVKEDTSEEAVVVIPTKPAVVEKEVPAAE